MKGDLNDPISYALANIHMSSGHHEVRCQPLDYNNSLYNSIAYI